MDPNPNAFPILSYVLSRFPSSLSKLVPPSSPSAGSDDFDPEQPPLPPSPAAARSSAEIDLAERMPGLRDPAVLAAMARAVADVSRARAALRDLGERPDHETVDAARSRLQDMSAAAARGSGDSPSALNKEAADSLRFVLKLDEMHEAYGNLLHDAETRLEKLYRAAMDGKIVEEAARVGNKEEVNQEEVNEEVVRILQAGSSGVIDRVDLSDRQLRLLPEAFGKLQGLVYLNVSQNLLETIPDAIGGLDSLEELHMASNLLLTLPDSIGLLSNLKILNVSGNKLKALPDSISKCRSLVELDASYNELTYLPTAIGNELSNLQKLVVHLNKLRTLPRSVCEMRSLRVLDMRFNELRGLPSEFGKLKSLETLDLSSNFSDLTELPWSFGDLLNLRELDLSNNQIHTLPETFGRLDKLQKLNLDQNPLTEPPLEVVSKGLEAVKEYMAHKWLDMLLEEENRSVTEKEQQSVPQSPVVWLTRSMSSIMSGVSGSLSQYLGAGGKNEDSFLDEQL